MAPDWEDHNELVSLTHLDGRNGQKLISLRRFFSEYAWMRERLEVMVRYLIRIHGVASSRVITGMETKRLLMVSSAFSLADAQTVVSYERRVNHDLKALELFLAASLKKQRLTRLLPYINLGIGSEDINSIAMCRLLTGSREEVLRPAVAHLLRALIALTDREKDTGMVARTHAQAANVTTFGKELANPLLRLCDEITRWTSLSLTAKCSGEVGSYQALSGIPIRTNWIAFTDTFIRSFGLIPTHTATQIAPYESIVSFLESIRRINTILLDLVKNMWLYVLIGYGTVITVRSEVGSAGMPHKVNPIYFEGAEGGLTMANGMIETLTRTLPINRLQRDFSDSTMRRNMVLPIAYSLLSYQSIATAFERITVNHKAIADDLERHPQVWLETVKTYGLSHGIADMYDRLKEATQGRSMTRDDLVTVIRSLPLNHEKQEEIIQLCRPGTNPYPARIVDESVTQARKLLSSL